MTAPPGTRLVRTLHRNNRRRRAARVDADARPVEFVRASNLPPPSASHMRRALYRLEDPTLHDRMEFFETAPENDETETFTCRSQEQITPSYC